MKKGIDKPQFLCYNIIEQIEKGGDEMAMSIKQVAEYSGASYATVRRMKIKLGRMPTIEEVIERKRKVGRPTTEYEKQFALKTLSTNRTLRLYVERLIEVYGENITLKEILERNN